MPPGVPHSSRRASGRAGPGRDVDVDLDLDLDRVHLTFGIGCLPRGGTPAGLWPMSKLKSPHQKKTASYDRDRRSVFGANDKAQRKNLPRKKARLNRAVRHEVHLGLHVDGAPVEQLDLDAIDTSVATVVRKRFKKQPAVPLADFIGRQREKRVAPKPAAKGKKRRTSAAR